MQCREATALPDVPNAKEMELYIETLTGTAFELRVSPFDTVLSVKAKIQRTEGIPVSQQHLIWQSRELEDNSCLQDYNIGDGSTLKLVLAMRGGPINTRRVPVEDPAWREMVEYMESNRDEIWERMPGGRQVTLLIYRDGDQINFFRVIDRGDGTLSPLAESIGALPTYEESMKEKVASRERMTDNAVTSQKMKALRKKMDSLTIKNNVPAKKVRNHNPLPSSSMSRTSTPQVIAVKSNIHRTAFSLNKHVRLPPVKTGLPTVEKRDERVREKRSSTLRSTVATTVDASDDSEENLTDNQMKLEDRISFETGVKIRETGALPKLGVRSGVSAERSGVTAESGSGRFRARPSAVDTYRRSLMQLRTQSSVSSSPVSSDGGAVSDLKFVDDSIQPGSYSPTRRKISFYQNSFENKNVDEAVANVEPSVSFRRPSAHPLVSASATVTTHGDRRLLRSQQHNRTSLDSSLHVEKDELVGYRPKTTPEKWNQNSSSSSEIGETLQEFTQSSKDLCDILNRTKPKNSPSSASHTEVIRGRGRRSQVVDPLANLGSSNNVNVYHIRREKNQDFELLKALLFSDEALEKNSNEAQDGLTRPGLQRRLSASRHGQLNSAHKLPPVNVAPKVTTTRCQVCHKKTGLATSYTCRCGRNFCATHRYAETHNCTYDYKTEGRRALEQANPLIAAPKLPKI